MKKAVFIFSGLRKQLLTEIQSGKAPDTRLYGMNHIRGFETSIFEFGDTMIGKYSAGIIGFRPRHALSYFWVRSADIVCGSSLLFLMPFRALFKGKAKYVFLNMSLNRFLVVNSKNVLLRKISRWLVSRLDRIVSLSTSQMNELDIRFGIPKEKLSYVPLGVDISFYQLKYGGRKDYILSVGKDNGRDYETVVKVAKQMPQIQFRLVLEKRNLASIRSIPPNIEVLCNVNIVELCRMYNEAALLLLITHRDGHEDGSDCSGQTVLLDAMATGLPVIATKKAYIQDYAVDGSEIILVEPYDASGIKKTLETITAEKKKSLARAARARVEKDFSSVKMGERLSGVFESL